MAKKKGWFDRVKRFFVADTTKSEQGKTKGEQEKKERRKRWLIGRLKSKRSPALPPPSTRSDKAIKVAEEEQNKHAMAVAVATAVAAEAAIAAAEAAAHVVRLTGTPLSYHKSRELAAISIQSVFRGYLARKALQALKGLVKLQALIRGQAVRRQTTITLRGLQSLMKIQSEARASRVKVSSDQAYEDKNIDQWNSSKSVDIRTTVSQNGEKKWDSSTLSKDEINATFRSRIEAALKRERALEYASSQQERRNLRRPSTPPSKHHNVSNQRWSWLDQWMGAQSLDKEITEVVPPPSPDQNVENQHYLNAAPERVVLLDPIAKEESEVMYNLARRSFNRSRRTPVRDDDSLASSPALRNYMVSTASTKARFRSMSTPKQRPGDTDARSDDRSTPFTDRLLSPFPSIASEAGTSPMLLHPKSPQLSGRTGPVKSRRSPNYLSIDSERSLLNWDSRSAFR